MYKLFILLVLFLVAGCANNVPLTKLENNKLQIINSDFLKNALIDNIIAGGTDVQKHK